MSRPLQWQAFETCIVGCYSLALYCQHHNDAHEYGEFPQEYIGELGTNCRAEARSDGWILHRNGKATCPKCNICSRKRKRMES